MDEHVKGAAQAEAQRCLSCPLLFFGGVFFFKGTMVAPD